MLEKIHKAVPGTTVMAMSAWIEKLCVAVTASSQSAEWLSAAVGPTFGKSVTSTETGVAYVVIDQNIEQSVFPIQLMEVARSNAFGYLKANNLIKDEDSDDDDAILTMEL